MKSSMSCAAWPLAIHEDSGVSGVNITSLRMDVDDMGFKVNFTGGTFGQDWNDEFAGNLEDFFTQSKANILGNLSTAYSHQAADMLNHVILQQIPQMHREQPCTHDTVQDPKVFPAVNVSQVCFSNNGGYALKWQYHNCPTHGVSAQTPSFPIDQSRCMDVLSVWPDAKEGQLLRVASEAVAGLHEIIDPPLRFVPNSNAAGFQCSGTTLDYRCNFLSLAPVDPTAYPKVQKVCILNHAGFVMWYEAKNKRTSEWVAKTGNYAINKKECIDMGDTNGAVEGDLFKFKTHAVLGKKQGVDRDVEYSDNGMMATFECRGTTLNYECKILVGMMDVDKMVV